MPSLDEMIVVKRYDHDSDRAMDTVTTLENIIKDPSGFNMEEVGLLLFNMEREKRGLSTYKKNCRTGTFDEVS